MLEPAEPFAISRIGGEPRCFNQRACGREALLPYIHIVSLRLDQQCGGSFLRDLRIAPAQQIKRVAIDILQHSEFLVRTPRIHGVERLLIGREEDYRSEEIGGDWWQGNLRFQDDAQGAFRTREK